MKNSKVLLLCIFETSVTFLILIYCIQIQVFKPVFELILINPCPAESQFNLFEITVDQDQLTI